MWKLKRDKILSKKKKKEVHKVLEVKQVCFATVYVELFFFFLFPTKTDRHAIQPQNDLICT